MQDFRGSDATERNEVGRVTGTVHIADDSLIPLSGGTRSTTCSHAVKGTRDLEPGLSTMDSFPNPMSLKMLVPEESNQSLAGNRGDTSYPFLDEGARGEERRTEGVRGPWMASMPSDHGDLAGGWKPAGARALVQVTFQLPWKW
eukprot:751219-Hanusia_phi.AAC.2